MLRFACALMTSLAVVAVCDTVKAEWFERMREAMKRDFHRNNCWPEPFIHSDRISVTTPLSAIVANGYRRQNLLGHHHFTPDSTGLSQSGKLKVEAILTQSPPRFRAVFVERGPTRDATAARLDAVENWSSEYLPDNIVADVRESHLKVEGRPASVVDSINVRFRQTQPSPQLSAPSGEDF